MGQPRYQQNRIRPELRRGPQAADRQFARAEAAQRLYREAMLYSVTALTAELQEVALARSVEAGQVQPKERRPPNI